MFALRTVPALTVACSLAAGMPAFAQSQTKPSSQSPTPSAPWPQLPNVPDQIGNIWNGLAHQPTQAEVEAREKQSGIAPSGQQQTKLDEEVEQLSHQLLSTHVPTDVTSGTGR
jgi:hypothetical protein